MFRDNNTPKDIYKNWLFGDEKKEFTRKRSNKKLFTRDMTPGTIADLAYGKQKT